MNEPDTTLPPKKRCMPCPLMLVGGLVLFVIAFAWVSEVVHKVFNGAGLQYCCAIEGVRFNYISAFVLLCAVAVALLFATIVHVRDWRIRRDFERKYGVKISSSSDRSTSSSDSNAGPTFHGAGDGD